MEPIETRYEGYRFRSRLEARWAVFFDIWGVKWQYEPDTFKLPSGRCYLPDFYLDGIGYVECKPSRETDDGKLGELAQVMMNDHINSFLICCEVPGPSEISAQGLSWSGDKDGIICGIDDAEYWFTQCPTCGKKGITYQGRYPRLGCPCSIGVEDRSWNERAVMALRVACVAARSMRFEELSRL